MQSLGKIIQVVGPVVDVEFTQNVPALYQALTVDYKVEGADKHLTLEVQQHLAKTVCARSRWRHRRVVRGMEVVDTGAPIAFRWAKRFLGAF
jgi:F-type H+-transporting ATPase subunit beta